MSRTALHLPKKIAMVKFRQSKGKWSTVYHVVSAHFFPNRNIRINCIQSNRISGYSHDPKSVSWSSCNFESSDLIAQVEGGRGREECTRPEKTHTTREETGRGVCFFWHSLSEAAALQFPNKSLPSIKQDLWWQVKQTDFLPRLHPPSVTHECTSGRQQWNVCSNNKSAARRMSRAPSMPSFPQGHQGPLYINLPRGLHHVLWAGLLSRFLYSINSLYFFF